MNKVKLERFLETEESTIGKIYINGEHFCYSLELPDKNNEPFISRIPEGQYQCLPYSSKKYPDVVELQNVKNRSKILIHAGNYPKDTQGCIILGYTSYKKNYVGTSKKALKEFFKKTSLTFELEIINPFKENKKVVDKFLDTLKEIDLAKEKDLHIERLKLEMEIQEAKGELQKDIVTLRGDLELKIQAVNNDLIQWYIGGMIALGGFLFAILTHFLK